MFYMLMAALVAVAIFVIGYLIGKGTRSDLSALNQKELKNSTEKIRELESEITSITKQKDEAFSALTQISRGTAVPEIIAGTSINTIRQLATKE